MKRVITLSCLIAVLTVFSVELSTAQYVTGIGLRGGKFNTGLSFKRFVNANNNVGVETWICRSKIGKDYGWVAKGFWVYQRPIMDARMQAPIDIVFGAGVHGGYYKYGYYYIENGVEIPYALDVYTFGLDCMIGLEYKLPWLPLSITADCNPFIEVVNKGPEHIDFGVSLRYVMR